MLMTCEEGDMGRYGEIWGDMGRTGDMGRYGEMLMTCEEGRDGACSYCCHYCVLLLLLLLRSAAAAAAATAPDGDLVRQPLIMTDKNKQRLPTTTATSSASRSKSLTPSAKCCRKPGT